MVKRDEMECLLFGRLVPKMYPVDGNWVIVPIGDD